MNARRERAQRRWEPVRALATVTRPAERAPVPWAVVLERLHAAAASGELALPPASRASPGTRSAGRGGQGDAEARRRLLEAIARRARSDDSDLTSGRE